MPRDPKGAEQPAGERFFASFKVLIQDGYLQAAAPSFRKKKENSPVEESREPKAGEDQPEEKCDREFLNRLNALKKGAAVGLGGMEIREGETSPPKRYNSGTLILAMENAGQLIEDEELRAQIKGSGIGTSERDAAALVPEATFEESLLLTSGSLGSMTTRIPAWLETLGADREEH